MYGEYGENKSSDEIVSEFRQACSAARDAGERLSDDERQTFADALEEAEEREKERRRWASDEDDPDDDDDPDADYLGALLRVDAGERDPHEIAREIIDAAGGGGGGGRHVVVEDDGMDDDLGEIDTRAVAQAIIDGAGPDSLRRLYDQQLTVRAVALERASLAADDRSIDALIASDRAVAVWDYERGIVDEVLVPAGGEWPDQVPLLDSHDRFSIAAVLGSVRALRADTDAVYGTLRFSDADEAARGAWSKVQEGHVTDVSAGYAVREATWVKPGESAKVDGVKYTAGRRWLRISTRWSMKEVSLVPIGADEFAKVG